ncbi:17785_t:CDS:2 [Racocetra persica]|uniref:17785_t:CDS:1 n=1 Tax=Racocetra persica TaxID=160502 RepID=A0ACA9KYC8_9GLOM|nr:17785_t:CDS:2 [Racocetra persica]
MPVDYIEYILNNPTIAPNLYFGPGIVCDEKHEFWHSTLWQNLSLFGETKLCINNITYQAGNFLYYHQDKAIKFARICSVVEVNKRQLLRANSLVPYSGLSGHLRSINRKAHRINMEELWLVEGQEYLIILENITQINVWLKDLDRPVEYEYFVTEILYSFNTDLLQGNNLASVLRHDANYGCRTCSVSSSQLTNSNFDFVTNAHFYHLTNIQYNEIPVLDTLYWDRYLQLPQDAYHVLASKATCLLDITLRYLNTNREVAWLKCWKNTLRLAMLMLFILRYFLSPSYLKAEIIKHLKNVYKLTRNDHAIIKLIELWLVEAKLLKLAFSTITNNTYKELCSLFEKEQIGFLKIFLDIFENLPNVHVNVYLPQHACIFATLVNISVGVKEMVYKLYKNMVPHTNYKNIKLDLLGRYNTSFALTHLFEDGKDYHFLTTINKLSNISPDISLYLSLCKQYTTEQNLKINNNNDIKEIEIISNLIPKKFIEIVLQNKWPKTRANIEGWSTKLSS